MTRNRLSLRSTLAVALAATLATGILAIAFAGWIGHGSSILLSMAESGLAWCF